MAAFLALVLIVPGSLFVMGALAIVWTALFASLHVVSEVVSTLRSQVRSRVQRAKNVPDRSHRGTACPT